MWQSEFFGAAGMYALPRSRCANYLSVPKQKGMIFTAFWGGVLGSKVGHGDRRTAAIIMGSLADAAVDGCGQLRH